MVPGTHKKKVNTPVIEPSTSESLRANAVLQPPRFLRDTCDVDIYTYIYLFCKKLKNVSCEYDRLNG